MAAAIDSRQLTDAFRNFTELSSSLEASYRDLEAQVVHLSDELRATRRSRQEEASARQRLAGRFEGLLNALPGGVLLLDAAAVVRDCNPAAIELLGGPLVGLEWSAVCQRSMQRASVWGGEVPLASGRHVSVAQRPLGTEPGRVVLVTDVTEAHLVRDVLERNQRLSALGEVAARLAHQIRTPLAAAMLYGSQLTQPQLAPERRQELGARVLGRLRHLEQLVADMLAFARGPGAGSADLSVSALLEDVAQSLASRLKQGGQLTIRTRAPDLAVRGNRDALVGAIVNLVVNALDIAGVRAEVTVVASEPEPGLARIVVYDNGPGVPEPLRERIFEPFFTTRAGGTGLGLAVVKSVAIAHGGSVRLEPESLGATFIIDLPARGRAGAGAIPVEIPREALA